MYGRPGRMHLELLKYDPKDETPKLRERLDILTIAHTVMSEHQSKIEKGFRPHGNDVRAIFETHIARSPKKYSEPEKTRLSAVVDGVIGEVIRRRFEQKFVSRYLEGVKSAIDELNALLIGRK
ncbi:MAG: hypothetical protein V1835_05025 [Candidatus Micrarchaeota archaeon]